MKELASLSVDRSSLIAALQAQNVVQPAGTIQTGYETLALRLSGAFRSEQDVMNTNFAVGNRMLRLGDIAQVRRSFADPPQPLFRINGEPGIGLAIAMRDGGDILALGTNVKRVIAELTENLPLGIRPQLVADQAVTVKQRHSGIHRIAVAGDRHHPRRQLCQSRSAPRLGHRAGDPTDPGNCLCGHATRGTSTCNAFPWARLSLPSPCWSTTR